MPYRNQRPLIDVTKKTGRDFDHWLKSNISDYGYREWYRSDRVEREKWLDELAAQVPGNKHN